MRIANRQPRRIPGKCAMPEHDGTICVVTTGDTLGRRFPMAAHVRARSTVAGGDTRIEAAAHDVQRSAHPARRVTPRNAPRSGFVRRSSDRRSCDCAECRVDFRCITPTRHDSSPRQRASSSADAATRPPAHTGHARCLTSQYLERERRDGEHPTVPVGRRMNLHTRTRPSRRDVRALDAGEARVERRFGIRVPRSGPDVPREILDPRATWADAPT
jgi:hypothetical protein